MLVSVAEAQKEFWSFPDALRAPSLDPAYVQADADRFDAEPFLFVYSQGNAKFYHPMIARRVPASTCIDLQSAYGYGGPISTSDNPEFLASADKAFSTACSEQGVLAAFVRFHPLLRNWRFFNAPTRVDRETIWLDLTADFWRSADTRVRTAVKKAEKLGARVEFMPSNEFIGRFETIYNDTMTAVGAGPEYFFGKKYLSSIAEMKGAELALTLLNDQPLAAAIFLTSGEIGEYYLSGSTPLGKRLGATNLLIVEGAKRLKSLGMKFLHLGGGTDPSPTNRLLFFKAGFSPLRSEFRIAGRVFDEALYSRMKATWESQHAPTSRVLFYR